MNRLVSIFIAVSAATVFAAPEAKTAPGSEMPQAPSAGIMPSGPLLGPLTPDSLTREPVAVPEPVWASVLAACAVSLLRRGRH